MSPRRFPVDDPGRRVWQDPETVLDAIGLAEGMTFLDVGCGEGYFTLPAARRVGPAGRVCGIDVNPAAIARLRDRASAEGLGRVFTRAGPAEEVPLCPACGDVVFFGICLHDFSDPGRVLRNAREMIRPQGILADLDWHRREMPLGPPLEKRFDPDHAAALIRAAGFRIESIRDCGPYHYLVIARPE